MHHLINDMQRYRRIQRRADYAEAICKFIIVVFFCLLAYSCAEDERHAPQAQGVYRGR